MKAWEKCYVRGIKHDVKEIMVTFYLCSFYHNLQRTMKKVNYWTRCTPTQVIFRLFSLSLFFIFFFSLSLGMYCRLGIAWRVAYGVWR